MRRNGFLSLAVSLSTLLFVLLSSNSGFARDGDLERSFGAVLSNPGQGVTRVYVLPDSSLLVAGSFKVANGTVKVNLVRLSSTGTVDPSLGAIFGSTDSIFPTTSVLAVLVQPDGKLIVGGQFNTVNGIASNNIVRLNADWSVDTTFNIGTGFSKEVTSLVLQPDGKILVGGNFSSFNGITRTYLARLNSDGTLDTSLSSTISSFWASTMYSVQLLSDGKIFIQGAFHSVNSTSRRGLARLNSNGSLDTSFVEPGTYSLFNGMNAYSVRPDGKILIGGFFEIRVSNQLVCQNLCLLNTDGTLDTSYFVPFPANSSIRLMYLQADGRLMVHGSFQTINGQARNGTTRLNADGTVDGTFNPAFSLGLNGGLSSIVPLPADGGYLLPGTFTSVNGTLLENLARINMAGDVDTSFTPQFGSLASFMNSVAIQPDGKVIVAGEFNRANGVLRTKIARFDVLGVLDSSFDTSVTNGSGGTTLGSDSVFEVAVQPDGKILIGGDFAQINGQNRRYLARLNADGSTDTTFNPVMTYEGGGSGYVRSIAVQPDGKIVIGGNFLTVSGVSKRNYARLNADGSLDASFVVPFDTYVPSVSEILLQPDGKTVIGGDFRFTGNAATFSVARLNTDGSLDPTFVLSTDPSATPYGVWSLARLPNGKILVGGTWNFENRPRVKRLNADGTPDGAFNAGQIGVGFNWDRVDSIIPQPNGKILIGGGFSTINGIVRQKVARLRENGSLDYSFQMQAPSAEIGGNPSAVFAMAQLASGDLIVAGRFDRIGNGFASGVARLQIRNRPAFDFDGDGKTDIGIFRPSVGEWWVNRSSNGSTFATQFGATTDKVVPGDFTGDGKADIAVWRPSTGEWLILRSEDASYFAFPFGTNGDVAAPADYDGDGKADATVFRPSNATWFSLRSGGGGTSIQQFGATGDVPVVADYDADGRADVAIYRPSAGEWWINRSTDGVAALAFGDANDKPVQGDYTGDGKSDVAYWRPSTGEWFILRSEDYSYYAVPYGLATDIPAPGDYDGDGRIDPTVFRPSNAAWFINRTSAGTLIVQFGANGDRPLANAFVP